MSSNLDISPVPAPRWWRRPAVVLTAAALATLLVVGGGAFIMLRGSDGDDSALGDITATQATTTAPTTTIPPAPAADPVTWERLRDQASLRYAFLEDVVEFDGRLFAVGFVPDDGYEPSDIEWTSDGAVWTSNDGFTWDRVDTIGLDGPESLQLEELIVVPDGLLAIGREGSWVAFDRSVFASTDGREWTRVAELGPIEIAGRFVTDDGWLVVGHDARIGATAWTTPDLVTWNPVSDADFASIAEGRLTYVFDAVEVPDGYLAVGSDGAGTYEISRSGLSDCAAAWFSVDGLDWVRIDPYRLCDSDSGLWQVAEVDGRFYADGGLVQDLWLFDDTVYPVTLNPVEEVPAAYDATCPPIGVVRSTTGYEVYDSSPIWIGEVGVDRLTLSTWPPTGETFCATTDGGQTWSAFQSSALGGDSVEATSAIAWNGRFILLGQETISADRLPGRGVVWVGTVGG